MSAQLMRAPGGFNQDVARTIGGTLSPMPSGTVYTLNSSGEVLVQRTDIGYFASQGFTQVGALKSIIYNTGVATGTTDFVIATLPPGTYIAGIFASEAAAAAVTGGVDIGTTANGVDVVSALAVGASADTFVADAALLKRTFSLTASQAIHAAAHTAWNSANVTFTIVYGYN